MRIGPGTGNAVAELSCAPGALRGETGGAGICGNVTGIILRPLSRSVFGTGKSRDLRGFRRASTGRIRFTGPEKCALKKQTNTKKKVGISAPGIPIYDSSGGYFHFAIHVRGLVGEIAGADKVAVTADKLGLSHENNRSFLLIKLGLRRGFMANTNIH